MEVFTSEDVTKILWKKLLVVIGDSIQRCVYKDLVCLLSPGSNTRYLTPKELKAKGEINFVNDQLLQGGQLGDVKTGINYREVRQYDSGTSVVKFYFATRCYSDHLESVLNELKAMQPHAIIMNSCLWDLHRYGPRGPDSYHINMKKLMDGLKKVIPSDAVFIWNSTLPLDSKCKGGFLLPYFENVPAQEIVEANFIAADIVRSYGFVFLDLHSIFVNQLYHRAKDGIHWNHFAHRRISNLILLHLCRAWNLPVPKRMPLDIPREPRLYPLAERPHNASFGSYTSHLHIDRYGFNPSADARYVVQKPNTYKDRFRLMGSPIINSSTIVSKDNQMASPIIPDLGKESAPSPRPTYASSPIETVPKTKSLLQQSKSTSNLGSPLTEGHLVQELGISQNLHQEFKDSSQDERRSSDKVLACSSPSKILASSFSDTSGRESALTSTALTNNVSQSSSLVIQVSSTCTAGREKELSSVNRQSTNCTPSIKPVSSLKSFVSQVLLPALQRTSQVTKATTPHVTMTTTCTNNQSNVCAPHVSHVSLPVSQVTPSQVTKTSVCINQGSTICTSVNKILASMIGHRPQLSPLVTSCVTTTTQCAEKKNAPCTAGESIPSLAVSLLRKNDLSTQNQPNSTITTVRTPQQTANIPVMSNQEGSSLNAQSQKEPLTLKSSVESVVQTKDELCVGGGITHQNKPSKINDVSKSSKLPNKTQAVTEVTSGKRKASVNDLKRKASDNVGPKKQKLPESNRTNTSGQNHGEAKKAFSDKFSSTKLSKVPSGGQKRKATGDEGTSRITKQYKVEKKAEDFRKPSSNLKRKASTENPVNENINQPHHNLEPPAKRGKNNSTTSHQYTMRNALPLSGPHSTASSTSQLSIPVYSGNRIETTNVYPQAQCIPSYNFAQSNCYWTGSQQSLQDIQQQQQWFNTLLSRGRAGPYMNSAQPSLYYNNNTRPWQLNQGYYYSNNYRY